MSDDLDLRQGADDTPESPRARWLRRLRDAAVSISLLLVVWIGLGWLRAPSLPDVAPAFALQDLEGRTVSLADLRGKTVVLNFWATWCGPCRYEIPTLSRFASNNPDIPVLGIAVDGTPALLRKAATELGVTYPVLIADAATKAAYGVHTLPTTIVVSPDGAVEAAHAGLMTAPHLWWITR